MTSRKEKCTWQEALGGSLLLCTVGIIFLQAALRALGPERGEWAMHDTYMLWMPGVASILGIVGIFILANRLKTGPQKYLPRWMGAIAAIAFLFLLFQVWVWSSRFVLLVLDLIGGRELIWAYAVWDDSWYALIATIFIGALLGIPKSAREHLKDC